MKKSLKNLELKKQTISSLNLIKVKGGGTTTVVNCDTIGCGSAVTSVNFCGNSVPVAQGGIGCHAQ